MGGMDGNDYLMDAPNFASEQLAGLLAFLFLIGVMYWIYSFWYILKK